MSRIPVQDYVAATSVGIIDSTRMLDLAYEEDSRAEVDMNVVMTGRGKFIEVQGTAEALPFGRDALNDLLDLAHIGIGKSDRASEAGGRAHSEIVVVGGWW